jgi:hypothetical protein
MSKEIRFNAFAMNCVGHMAPGLWRHPRDRSERYIDLNYWTDLARLLERGKFDGLFLADVLGESSPQTLSTPLSIDQRQRANRLTENRRYLLRTQAYSQEDLGSRCCAAGESVRYNHNALIVLR